MPEISTFLNIDPKFLTTTHKINGKKCLFRTGKHIQIGVIKIIAEEIVKKEFK